MQTNEPNELIFLNKKGAEGDHCHPLPLAINSYFPN